MLVHCASPSLLSPAYDRFSHKLPLDVESSPERTLLPPSRTRAPIISRTPSYASLRIGSENALVDWYEDVRNNKKSVEMMPALESFPFKPEERGPSADSEIQSIANALEVKQNNQICIPSVPLNLPMSTNNVKSSSKEITDFMVASPALTPAPESTFMSLPNTIIIKADPTDDLILDDAIANAELERDLEQTRLRFAAEMTRLHSLSAKPTSSSAKPTSSSFVKPQSSKITDAVPVFGLTSRKDLSHITSTACLTKSEHDLHVCAACGAPCHLKWSSSQESPPSTQESPPSRTRSALSETNSKSDPSTPNHSKKDTESTPSSIPALSDVPDIAPIAAIADADPEHAGNHKEGKNGSWRSQAVLVPDTKSTGLAQAKRPDIEQAPLVQAVLVTSTKSTGLAHVVQKKHKSMPSSEENGWSRARTISRKLMSNDESPSTDGPESLLSELGLLSNPLNSNSNSNSKTTLIPNVEEKEKEPDDSSSWTTVRPTSSRATEVDRSLERQLTQACWAQRACHDPTCSRIHGEFEPTQDAHYRARRAESNAPAVAQAWGHAVCAEALRASGCPVRGFCTYRHFVPGTLRRFTEAQRAALNRRAAPPPGAHSC